MSISGTVHRHGTHFGIGYSSMGGVEPGADFRRSRPLLCFAKLAVALRSHTAVSGDRCPLRLLHRDADHGQDFPETSKCASEAVILVSVATSFSAPLPSSCPCQYQPEAVRTAASPLPSLHGQVSSHARLPAPAPRITIRHALGAACASVIFLA